MKRDETEGAKGRNGRGGENGRVEMKEDGEEVYTHREKS